MVARWRRRRRGSERMSAARSIPWKTKQDQWRASDPKLSAWVSAHAGSGKTHVLSQRVVRLLLARVPPSRILCLTYTKAAAANMAARIFDILAQMDAARRRRARQRGRKGLRTAARPRGARFRAPTFRAHGGDARRIEGPDDPRLLRKDFASLSVRGQCSRRLSHHRRYRARRVAGRRAQGDAGSRS